MDVEKHAACDSNGDAQVSRAESMLEIVQAQRGMMWLLIAKLGMDYAVGTIVSDVTQRALIGYTVAYFTVGIAIAYFVFRLANVIYGIGPAIVCAALTLVPCMGLLTVLILNGSTIDRLRKAGVIVGIMGATKTQLQQLRDEATEWAAEQLIQRK